MKRFAAILLAWMMLGLSGVVTVGAQAVPGTMAHECHTFRVATEEEAAYLVKAGALNTANIRFADTTNEIIYKFDIKNSIYIQNVQLSGPIYQQLLLLVSADGKTYTEVYRWVGEDEGDDHGRAADLYTYDLTPYLDTSNIQTIYIKIADAYSNNGWGGAINPNMDVTLDVCYMVPTAAQLNALEATANEHSVPLFGCNTNWGAGYTLDKENRCSGYAALSVTLKGGDTVPFVVLDEPVDGSGMDTLEFELYVSDLSVFGISFTGALELSSAGKPEHAALAWPMQAIFAAIDETRVGWNHVSLPLKDATSTDKGGVAFDVGAVNFLRFYWTGLPKQPNSPVLKIDNFRLTDAQAQARAASMLAMQPLLDIIEQLEEMMAHTLSEDNFKTFARLTHAAKQDYHELKGEQLTLAKEYNILETLEEAEVSIKAYEKALEKIKPSADEEPDEPTTPVDALPDDPVLDDPSFERPSDEPPAETDIIAWGMIIIVALMGGTVLSILIVLALKTKKRS